MSDLLEKSWYKPKIWKGFEKEETRLMGKIKTEFNLDTYFTVQDESDAKTFLASAARNVTIDMLVKSKKIEVKDV